jgi:outer membrane protein OmpA-like peptidoglycan-associated protein
MEQQVPLPIVAMRPLLFLSAVLMSAATPGLAQVTVDLHALQALPERPANPPSPRPASPAVSRVPAPAAPAPIAPSATARATPAPPSATAVTPPPSASAIAPTSPLPAMPETEPDTAMINPITPPGPPAGSPPPPPPPVSDKAATTAAPTTSGLRLTFAPGQSDLSPDSTAAIRQLTGSASLGDSATFNILAYAPGTPDDPSTARRVSLSRAMAVRSALVANGVPSARIFVRALGAQYGDGPPDRADLTIEGTGNQATQK